MEYAEVLKILSIVLSVIAGIFSLVFSIYKCKTKGYLCFKKSITITDPRDILLARKLQGKVVNESRFPSGLKVPSAPKGKSWRVIDNNIVLGTDIDMPIEGEIKKHLLEPEEKEIIIESNKSNNVVHNFIENKSINLKIDNKDENIVNEYNNEYVDSKKENPDVNKENKFGKSSSDKYIKNQVILDNIKIENKDENIVKEYKNEYIDSKKENPDINKENKVVKISSDHYLKNQVILDNNNNNNNFEKKDRYKILVIGGSNVGKTCLIRRYVEDSFRSHLLSTVGLEYLTKKAYSANRNELLELQIWDTAGHERFRDLNKLYYKHADAFILAFDVCSYQSLETAENFVKEVNSITEKKIILLVGLKIDMENYREITYETAKDIAEKNKISYIEASAKNNTNVENVFELIINEIENINLISNNKIISLDQKKHNRCGKSVCC